MNELALFTDALARTDPAERAAFLEEACAGNPDVRRRLDELLAAHARGGSPLDRPPVAPAGFAATADLPAEPGTEDYGPGGATGTFGDTPAGRDRSTAVELGTVIAGRYTLVEVIGEGGMGSVYLARQSEPVKRQVALKLIKAGMDSKAVLARFDAERQALALMEHPNIARVFDGGTTPSGQPFFVMELVKGVPLTEYCDEHRLSVDARLQLFVSVCNAVQHAHQKGIIHRDLKPGNVLVTEVDGRPTPKVIDFGVAKATELKLTDISFADTGVIVGTPAYMSPEQADPSSMDIDTRTDVYALGVMLYELLTGSPPIDAKQFKRGAVLEMLRMVREVEPPRPSTKLSAADDLPNIAANRDIDPAKLAKSLRGELDWVVMKALEKDRTRRYDTANGLARDIQRYLADEVVEARPPSTGYRLKKFVRRHKGQVIAASLVLFALLAGMAGTTWGLFEAKRQEREAKKQEQVARGETDEKEKARAAAAERVKERDDALKQEAQRVKERDAALKREAERADELKHRLGVSNMLLAGAAYENRDVKLTAERLDKVPAEQRGWDWRYLKQQTRGGLFTLYGHKGPVTCVAFSPDGTRIVSGGGDQNQPGEVRVWDARTGSTLLELKGLPTLVGMNTPVKSVAFSPDGTRIITAGENNEAIVCDARTGKVLLELKGHTTPVSSMAFSRDGTRIVTGGDSQPRTLGGGRIEGIQGPGELKVWDTKTGEALLELKGHTGEVMSVSFSPDGTRIATGGGDFGMPDETKVWDALSGKVLLELKASNGIGTTVSFSPDGTRIVVGNDMMATVVDARTGTTLLELKGRARRGTGGMTVGFGMVNASFSPDGTRIVTAGGDNGEATVWDAKKGTPLLDLTGHTNGVMSVAFSPDGTRIVTGNMDGTLKVWDARTGSGRLELAGHRFDVHGAVFSPDGTRIVTGESGKPGVATVWDARTGMALFELKDFKGAMNGVAFSGDGTRIVTGGGELKNPGAATVWDAQTGMLLLELKGLKETVNSVAFSPDGTRIVTGAIEDFEGGGNELKVWDARTGKVLHDLTEPPTRVMRVGARGWSVAFSPDGTRIVAGGGRNSKSLGDVVKVWDARSGKVLLELTTNRIAVTSVSFSPDGQRIVTGDADATATVWDAVSGTLLLELKGHQGGVMSAAFSPDATRIVTGGVDRTVKVWDVRTGTTLVELKGHTGAVKSVSFNRDGTRIVSGGGEPGKPGEAIVWDARTVADPRELNGHLDSITGIAFSPDNSRIVTASHDKTAKVWDTKTGATLLDLNGHTLGLESVAFSPDGTRIVTGDGTTARVWDARTGTPLFELTGKMGTVRSVAFSPDGTRILTAGGMYNEQLGNEPGFMNASVAKVWDAKAGTPLVELKWPTGNVPSAEFNRDGTRIVTRNGTTVRVWDAQTGKELQGEAIPATVSNDRISPDGRIFARKDGKRVVLMSLKPDPEEIELRGIQMQPNFGRYREDYLAARTAKDDFAAAFYLNLIPQADRKALVAKADVDALAPLAKLAEEHLRAGKRDQAVPLFIEIVNVKKAALGPEDLDTLETMTRLGVIYWQLRQLDKSVPLFEELLKSREAKHGRDHLESLRAAANLAVNYRDAGKLKEAIPLLEEAQRATKKHPELRWVTGQLIDAYTKAEEHDKATNLMLENLAEARHALPKDSPQLANLLAQTGLILLEQKKWTVAEPLIRECLAIREKTQPDFWATFNTKSTLGGALLGQKKYAEAEPLLLKGYEGMKQRETTIPPQGKVRLPEALDRLIELYTATNKLDEAKKWRAERAKYDPVEQAPPPRVKR